MEAGSGRHTDAESAGFPGVQPRASPGCSGQPLPHGDDSDIEATSSYYSSRESDLPCSVTIRRNLTAHLD